MFRTITRILAASAAVGLLALPSTQATEARTVDQEIEKRQVDLVIALDVSGSMSGLIDSAKQRLWDIVNELGRANPQPELRVAILSYGNPSYGAQNGYVRIDQPFTGNLDAVNEKLFAFSTNGGDEYVARVVDTSVRSLQWSTQPDALRIIFVAGNEEANQDPQIPVSLATQAAADKGIVVNTIYCGSETDSIAAGWRDVATRTNGMYAAIDQNAAAVANVATPMDSRLAELNEALNATYMAYGGAAGQEHLARQHEQDRNAAEMSAPAAASRAVTKSGGLYSNAGWDLLDALRSGKALAEFEEEALPEPLQALDADERQAYVDEQAAKREEIQSEIASIAEERRDYIAEKRKEAGEGSEQGLDVAIQTGLRQVAEAKGFTFDGS